MIMKRLVLVTVLAVGAWAQETNNLRTFELYNGRSWNALSLGEKLAQIIGIWEGAVSIDEDKATVQFKNKATFGEMVTALDLFYQDSANAPIPIIWGLQVIATKNNGASAAELESRTTALRRFIAKPEGKPKETKY